jgi:hypothetical protein
MKASATYKGVIRRLKSSSPGIQRYFEELPRLLANFPLDVSLAYVFLRIERAQNRSLYCGVLKLHRAHAEVAERAVNAQHLTRDGFATLYANVFDREMGSATASKIKGAEKIRDRVVHGKSVKDADLRHALLEAIEYAEALNAELKALAGFEPFGDLRGFKGRRAPLEKATTRWLLKGLGFAIA